MPIYSCARATTNATIDQTLHGLITSAAERAMLLEAGFSVSVVGAGTKIVGYGFPAANGITPTSPVALSAENPGEAAAATTSALAWATSPTSPTNAIRRFAFPGGSGAGFGVLLAFPRGIVIPVSSNFVLQSLTATASTTVQSYFVIEE